MVKQEGSAGGFATLAKRPAFRISALVGLLALAAAALIGPDSSGWSALAQTFLIESGVAVVLIGIGAAVESQINAVETRVAALEDDAAAAVEPLVSFAQFDPDTSAALSDLAHETLSEMELHEWATAIRDEQQDLAATPSAVMLRFRNDLRSWLPEAALAVEPGWTYIASFEPDYPAGEISWSECIEVTRHGLGNGNRAWAIEAAIVRLNGGMSWVNVVQRIRSSWGSMTGEPANYLGDGWSFTHVVKTHNEIATLKSGLDAASGVATKLLQDLIELLREPEVPESGAEPQG
jgi:hypothetical protein